VVTVCTTGFDTQKNLHSCYRVYLDVLQESRYNSDYLPISLYLKSFFFFFVTGWSAFTIWYERDLHMQFKFMLRFQRVNFAPDWKSICTTKTATLSSPDTHVTQFHSTAMALFHERVRGATNISAYEVSRTRSWKRHQMRECITSCDASDLLRSGSGDKRPRAFVALQFLARF
jgi:hypothetical protein